MIPESRKSFLLLFILCFMATMALGGCHSGVENISSGGTPPAVRSEPDPAVLGTGPSWTWDRSPVTIDWYIDVEWYTDRWDTDRLIYRYMTEQTGVTVNITTPSPNNLDMLNSMIASGNLPAVLTGDKTLLAILEKKGKLAALNKLSEEYAPHLVETFPKSMQDFNSGADGNWYFMPNTFMAREQINERNSYAPNAAVLVRRDLMKSFGIRESDFSTQDGMIDALKKIRDSKPTYKDQTIYPIYLYAGDEENVFTIWFPQFFGVPTEDRDGHYLDPKMHPKMKECLQFGNRLYREGLLLKEHFTVQRSQMEEMIRSGRVFCLVGNLPEMSEYVTSAYQDDPQLEYTTVEPVRSADGSLPALAQDTTGWVVTVVTRDAANPHRIIRFFDYLASIEGQKANNVGQEGVTYDLSPDGYAIMKPEVEEAYEKRPDEARKKYGLGTFYWFNNLALIQHFASPPKEKSDIMASKLYDIGNRYFYDSAAWNGIGPEGDTREAHLQEQIEGYWRSQRLKMLMASSEEECGRIFDETVREMEAMDIDQVNKVIDTKFQKNKQKLGIRFAFPANMR